MSNLPTDSERKGTKGQRSLKGGTVLSRGNNFQIQTRHAL